MYLARKMQKGRKPKTTMQNLLCKHHYNINLHIHVEVVMSDFVVT
jgi:hypothetical protein